MGIGLKRNTVLLEEHNPAWEALAQQTVAALAAVLGEIAVDVQHIGSTAIRGIPAKPIIDIAVGVREVQQMRARDRELAALEIVCRGQDVPGQLLYVMGDFENDIRTHHIHAVVYGGDDWKNYVNFRDYLNVNRDRARAYAALKRQLALRYGEDRRSYTAEKQRFIAETLALAAAWRLAQTEAK